MFFKAYKKKFFQILKDSPSPRYSRGPRRVRGNFSQGGKTSRTYMMMKLTILKLPLKNKKKWQNLFRYRLNFITEI
jgi:hypothetical protein